MGEEDFGPVKAPMRWERVVGRGPTFMEAVGGRGGVGFWERDDIWNVNAQITNLKKFFKKKRKYVPNFGSSRKLAQQVSYPSPTYSDITVSPFISKVGIFNAWLISFFYFTWMISISDNQANYFFTLLKHLFSTLSLLPPILNYREAVTLLCEIN